MEIRIVSGQQTCNYTTHFKLVHITTCTVLNLHLVRKRSLSFRFLHLPARKLTHPAAVYGQ